MTVPADEKALNGRPGHLNDTQKALLEEFKQKVEEAHDQSQRKWYDDTTLL
jgi:hypothetical protein